MDDYIKRYQTELDELNIVTDQDIDQITEDVLDSLIRAYYLGIMSAGDMLDYELEVRIRKMRDAIYEEIEGKTFEDRIADHVHAGDILALLELAKNEFTRVYNTAVTDGGEEVEEETKKPVMKKWVTVQDNRVRESHIYLEGVEVPVGEKFYTYDGDSAEYPHGFGKAQNNVNCRCTVVLLHGEGTPKNADSDKR